MEPNSLLFLIQAGLDLRLRSWNSSFLLLLAPTRAAYWFHVLNCKPNSCDCEMENKTLCPICVTAWHEEIFSKLGIQNRQTRQVTSQAFSKHICLANVSFGSIRKAPTLRIVQNFQVQQINRIQSSLLIVVKHLLSSGTSTYPKCQIRRQK